MISKYFNSHMNGKLTTIGFQIDRNYLISPCILKVIAHAIQCPNSDWKWIVDDQTLNWRVKWGWNFTIRYARKLDETRNLMKPKSNDFDLRIKNHGPSDSVKTDWWPRSHHLSPIRWSHVSGWASLSTRSNLRHPPSLESQIEHVSLWWSCGLESTRLTLLT